MKGGAKIGEGMHGIVYDLCNKGIQSFCKIIENSDISKITLYTVDGTKQIESSELFKITQQKGKLLAKIFKQKPFFSMSSAKIEFLQEIESNTKVSKILNNDLLTFFPDQLGVHIEGSDEMFVLFGIKCNNNFKVSNIKKFGKDILETLVVLNKEYLHNDVKEDNIVKCGNDYKLIDWGAVTSIDNPKSRTPKTTSPMKVYLEWGMAFVTKYIFTKDIHSSIKKTPEFKEQYLRIMNEFNYEVSTYYKEDLKKKFYGTHDVFQLGITMLVLVITENLDYQKSKSLIEKLTSLKEPLTAKEAISLF